jgi:DNA-binding NarL/FixJ family response regulator
MLLDERALGISWAEATLRMNKLAPKAKIIILSYPWKATDPIDVLKSGARGFISKDIEVEDLIRSIGLVHAGGLVIVTPKADKIFESVRNHDESFSNDKADYHAELTEREREVLAMTAQGLTNKEIAEALLMSEHTVKVHLRWIMAKLHVRNRQQVVARAVGSTMNSNYRTK